MHSKSDNMEFMTYSNLDGIIELIFGLLLFIYQIGLETQMRETDFIFDYVYLLFEKCHKIDFKRCGSYIDYPERIKFKNQ